MRAILFVPIVAALVVLGGIGLYYLTLPPGTGNATTSTGGPSGYQVGNTPYGTWADYLGYVPQGYNLAPHGVNAPTWPCPSGMSASQCQVFQQSCGNSVCDPNESCSTCPIDCAPSGAQTCDPYTGRAGSPVSVCLLGAAH